MGPVNWVQEKFRSPTRGGKGRKNLCVTQGKLTVLSTLKSPGAVFDPMEEGGGFRRGNIRQRYYKSDASEQKTSDCE